jgi:thiol-disulfide isomerase/thioredoxin
MREIADGTPFARPVAVRVLVLGLAALVLAGRVEPVAAARLALAPGDPAPPTLAAPIGAKTASWYQWKGAPVTVVNFWATWCEFCRTEMPVLEGLRARLAPQGLEIYGIALDGAADDAAITRYAKDLSIGYPLLRGSPEISDLWGTIGLLPSTFVIAADGRILRRYVGSTDETLRRMEAEIEALVAERAGPPAAAAPSAPSKD